MDDLPSLPTSSEYHSDLPALPGTQYQSQAHQYVPQHQQQQHHANDDDDDDGGMHDTNPAAASSVAYMSGVPSNFASPSPAKGKKRAAAATNPDGTPVTKKPKAPKAPKPVELDENGIPIVKEKKPRVKKPPQIDPLTGLPVEKKRAAPGAKKAAAQAAAAIAYAQAMGLPIPGAPAASASGATDAHSSAAAAVPFTGVSSIHAPFHSALSGLPSVPSMTNLAAAPATTTASAVVAGTGLDASDPRNLLPPLPPPGSGGKKRGGGAGGAGASKKRKSTAQTSAAAQALAGLQDGGAAASAATAGAGAAPSAAAAAAAAADEEVKHDYGHAHGKFHSNVVDLLRYVGGDRNPFDETACVLEEILIDFVVSLVTELMAFAPPIDYANPSSNKLLHTLTNMSSSKDGSSITAQAMLSTSAIDPDSLLFLLRHHPVYREKVVEILKNRAEAVATKNAAKNAAQ